MDGWGGHKILRESIMLEENRACERDGLGWHALWIKRGEEKGPSKRCIIHFQKEKWGQEGHTHAEI